MFTAPTATYSFLTQRNLLSEVHLSHPGEHCTGVLLVAHSLGLPQTHQVTFPTSSQPHQTQAVKMVSKCTSPVHFDQDSLRRNHTAPEPKGRCSSATDLSSQGRDSHFQRQWECSFSLFLPSCFKTTFEVALGFDFFFFF